MSRHYHSFQLADSSSVFCSFCLSTNILDDFCQSTLSWCVMEENARSRKRRRFPSAWKKANRKKNVVAGREHVSSSGSKKVTPGKKVKAGYTAGCKQRCSYTVAPEARQQLHDGFYAVQLESHDLQQAFIINSITRTDVHRVYISEQDRKKSRASSYHNHV